ncbi:hypothetical protein DFH09DRAFT_1097515 [Mycena vulgaris]|nr:hypothetical protein DFH09DRAFT_1097515 [Mycena vulgaris]
MSKAVAKRMSSPDPRYYTRSSTVAYRWYYRHPTDGAYGPDEATWVPPQTAPGSPPTSSLGAVQAPAPAPARQVSLPAQYDSRRTMSPSPCRRYRSPSPRSPSPRPRYRTLDRDCGREYAHEYGSQHRGAGYRSGPQHYRPARSRSRSPQMGPSRARFGQQDRSRDDYEEHRGEYRDSRRVGASRSSPRRPRYKRDTTRSSAPAAPAAAPPAAAPPAAAPPPAALVPAAAPARDNDVSSPFVPIPPPDLGTASRDGRGHPIFPVNTEESEYGGTSDDSDVAARRTARYKKVEAKRQCRAIERSQKAIAAGSLSRPTMPRNAASLGLWAQVVIDSLSDAHNLLRWSNAGEPRARRLVLHIEQEFGVGSGLERSEGVAHIMSQQAVSVIAYRMATTGLGGPQRKEREVSPFKDEELTAGDDLVVDDDAEMPLYVASYLGTSPPGVDESFAPSSRASALEAAAHFEEIGTANWPRICDDAGGIPTAARARPHIHDMCSHLTVEHLSPTSDGDTATMLAKAHFTEQSALMFSAAGMYERQVVVGKLQFAEIQIHDPYDPVSPMSLTHLAAWYSSHGIAIGTSNVLALESWARAFRNRVDKISDLENATFRLWPHESACAGRVPAEDIIAAAATIVYQPFTEDMYMGPETSF